LGNFCFVFEPVSVFPADREILSRAASSANESHLLAARRMQNRAPGASLLTALGIPMFSDLRLAFFACGSAAGRAAP
jgi:hypothetical protein